MGHSRAEGHEVQASTRPDDEMYLTNALTQGTLPEGQWGEGATFTLGSIVGSLQGDLLLTVKFTDGESVTERLDMSDVLGVWVGEITHSKRMRDDFGAGND